MSRPFDDITLYIPTPYPNTSPEYWEETSLHNFVSDLYVQKMNGYKPPNSTRVCIQPVYHGIWDRTWKNGSIFSIACEFLRDKYESLERQGKYRYILDIIQGAMVQLSDEYNWDKAIFEKAYRNVLACDFIFSIDYPQKRSKDQRKQANLRVEKNEATTFAYAIIETGSSKLKIKLFEKKNSWWYDCVYRLSQRGKWMDSDEFGIYYSKGLIEIYYSIKEERVHLLQSGKKVQEIEFSKFFLYEQ
jgi:hypothetical protein